MGNERIVGPSEIENELKRIWESLETTNTMRACLFNLIIYTQKGHRAGYIHKIAQKVIEKFPSRIIFVTIDKTNSEEMLKTEVSILSASQGEYDVACDFISIEASYNAKKKIPFIVLPHILPDLPVYLLWAEDPSRDDPLSYQLEQFSNRLIFDSESTDNLPRFAAGILKNKETSNADIADLNWARIESWREVLSSTFYSEERLEQLGHAQSILITYNAHESTYFCHTRIQAIYLQTWLSCQLKWSLKEIHTNKDLLRFQYMNGTIPLEVTLKPASHAELPPGLIISVEIMTEQEEHFAFIRRPQEPHQVTLQFSTPIKCAVPSKFFFTKSESGQSLVKEICHKGTSSHFLKVLNLIKTMEKLSQC